MPGKTDLSRLNCSLARALGSVGDWWTLLIVREAFFGSTRFGEFHASLGIARNILAQRLNALVADGIMGREGTPERPRYVLTDKGGDLLPALVALMQWGDKWQSSGRPPVILTDQAGRTLPRVRVNTRDGKAVTPGILGFRAGPGANEATRRFVKRARARPGSNRSPSSRGTKAKARRRAV
ncbi:MAG: helix-turn-helix transcriptional regulator [Hyphomicrobiaceae bacterium]|nr:helix-turn-helix transcriptional regulator [Hyphomicrobiaceae bacterium]